MYIVKSVGVHSLGKIMCGMHAVLGLIFAPVLGAAVMGSVAGGKSAPIGAAGVLLAVIVCPVLFSLLGFAGGTVAGSLYNLSARCLGGIELNCERLN